MTDLSPTPPSADPGTRAGGGRTNRRARRIRRRRNRILAAGGIIILAVLVMVLLTDTVRLPGDATSNVQAATETSPGDAPGPDLALRPVAPTTPMRLWIAGDSLAYVLGQELGKSTASTGVVKPVYDARVSSGLNSPGFFNWPEHAKKEIARLNPETIVFIIGANDLGVVGGSDWQQTYGARVDEMMTLLAGADRRVYWIGSPSMRNKQQHAAAKQLGAFMEERARRQPNIIYIDAFARFSDPKGVYQDRLPDANGKPILVRTDDGIHLTAAGGAILSDDVFRVLDREWRIQSQRVSGSDQSVEQTTGCCRTPSGSSNTQWQVVVPTTRTTATTATPASTSSSTTTTRGTSATTTTSSRPASSTTTATTIPATPSSTTATSTPPTTTTT